MSAWSGAHATDSIERLNMGDGQRRDASAPGSYAACVPERFDAVRGGTSRVGLRPQREVGMRVAVLGAGNGGVASAFDFAQHGHEVSLYAPPEFAVNTVAVHQAGGITASGDLEGFAPIRYAGHDVAEAVAGAELVVVVGPAYSTEPLAITVGPHLSDGMAVLVCPGSCAGAIAFKRAAGLELDDTRIVVGETHTLPYAVRVTEPGVINVFLKLTTGVYLAGVPRVGTERLYDLVRDVWPAVEKADSVFQTTLQNGNPIIHPAVTLLNAALLERTGGNFLFYEEGVTESVGRLIEAVDNERLAIAGALGVTVLSEPAIGAKQGYMLEQNYSTGYSTAPGFLGIAAQPQLDHRYLTEDVGYSLIFLADLATRLGVPTPASDAIITIASVVLARDFRGEGVRTLITLGLDAMSLEELAAL
jgi:opine dehydrogenase